MVMTVMMLAMVLDVSNDGDDDGVGTYTVFPTTEDATKYKVHSSLGQEYF